MEIDVWVSEQAGQSGIGLARPGDPMVEAAAESHLTLRQPNIHYFDFAPPSLDVNRLSAVAATAIYWLIGLSPGLRRLLPMPGRLLVVPVLNSFAGVWLTDAPLEVINPSLLGQRPLGVPRDEILGIYNRLQNALSGAGGESQLPWFLKPEIAYALEDSVSTDRWSIWIARPASSDVLTSAYAASGLPVASGESKAATGIAIEMEDRLGITTALHAIERSNVVSFAGEERPVFKYDTLRDIAVFDATPLRDDLTLHPNIDILELGLTPRENERAAFVSHAQAESPVGVRITAWDKSLLLYDPMTRPLIYSQPGTIPGDSGTALTSDDGKVLGFALSRTGALAALDHEVEYSSWVSAAVALTALGYQESIPLI